MSAWRELPEVRREEILRYARRGEHHPDRALAERWYLWARDHRDSWLAVLLNGTIGGEAIQFEVADRRDARLLRELGVPRSAPYCPDCHHRWDQHPDGSGTCEQCRVDHRRGLLTREVCRVSRADA